MEHYLLFRPGNEAQALNAGVFTSEYLSGKNEFKKTVNILTTGTPEAKFFGNTIIEVLMSLKDQDLKFLELHNPRYDSPFFGKDNIKSDIKHYKDMTRANIVIADHPVITSLANNLDSENGMLLKDYLEPHEMLDILPGNGCVFYLNGTGSYAKLFDNPI